MHHAACARMSESRAKGYVKSDHGGPVALDAMVQHARNSSTGADVA